MKLVILFAVSVCCLFACVQDTRGKHDPLEKSKTDAPEVNSLDSSIKIYTKGNDRYILLDTMKFQIPTEDSISTANIYKGIIDFRSNSSERHSFLFTKNRAFLTTFDDVGTGYRSYLYVFDLANRSLIKDSAFKNDYLYSSAGVFVIDTDSNRIFAVDKYAWYDSKGALIVPAGLYTVRGRYFKDIKSVYMLGGEIPSDTAVLSYFKNAISGKSNKVFKLPDNWWKIKSHKYF